MWENYVYMNYINAWRSWYVMDIPPRRVLQLMSVDLCHQWSPGSFRLLVISKLPLSSLLSYSFCFWLLTGMALHTTILMCSDPFGLPYFSFNRFFHPINFIHFTPFIQSISAFVLWWSCVLYSKSLCRSHLISNPCCIRLCLVLC